MREIVNSINRSLVAIFLYKGSEFLYAIARKVKLNVRQNHEGGINKKTLMISTETNF